MDPNLITKPLIYASHKDIKKPKTSNYAHRNEATPFEKKISYFIDVLIVFVIRLVSIETKIISVSYKVDDVRAFYKKKYN